jgi:hypothetical protein
MAIALRNIFLCLKSMVSLAKIDFLQPEKFNQNFMPNSLDPDKYARLKAELKTPYKGFRKFIYFSFGVSALLGALIFLTQLIAGRGIGNTLPNFALQVGVIALMVWLYRLE